MNNTRRLLFLGVILGAQLLSAQTRTITGRVTAEGTGEALPGTQHFVQDSFIGTTSDADGFYTLSDAPTDAFTLVVAFVGFKNRFPLQDAYHHNRGGIIKRNS